MCDMFASQDASLSAGMRSSPYIFDAPFSQIPSAHPFDNGEFSHPHGLSSPTELDISANARFDSQRTEETGFEDASFTQRRADSDSASSSFMAQHAPTTPSYEQVVGDFAETAQIEPYSSYHLGRPQQLRALSVPPQFFDFSQPSQSPGQSPDPLTFAPEAFYNPMSPGAHAFFSRYTQQSPSYSKQDYAQFPQSTPNPTSPCRSTTGQPPNTFTATDSGSALDFMPSNGPSADHDDLYPARGVTTEIMPTHVSSHREDAIPPREVFAQSRRVSDVSIRSADSNYMSSSPSTSSYIPSPSHTFTSPLPSPSATSPVISTTSYVPVTYNNATSTSAPTSSSPLSIPTSADPHVAAFLRERLGETKFTLFTSRLFERRFGSDHRGRNGTGSRKRGSVSSVDGPLSGTDGDGETKPTGETSTSAVEFLVKVEIVKEILRLYVPHPYNPQKSITYPFSGAPSGQVTLTRSTVLSLAGWSNTQFAYWARRAEAVSVLAPHDPKLKAVARALERRLGFNRVAGREGVVEDEDSKESASSENTEKVTGKGLDAIIEAVKRRTGASQFLRGKHSSLDAFGSTSSSNSNNNASGSGTASGPQSPTVAPSYSMGCLELSPPAPVPPESSTWYVDGAPGRGGMLSISMPRTRCNSMPSPWIERKPDITSPMEESSDLTKQAGTQAVSRAAKNPAFQAERYRHSPPPLASMPSGRRHGPVRGPPNLTISTAGLRSGRARHGEELERIPEKAAQGEPHEQASFGFSNMSGSGASNGINFSDNNANASIISPMSYDTPMTSPVSTLATEVTLRRNDIMFNAHVRPGAVADSSPISMLFSPLDSYMGRNDGGDEAAGGEQAFAQARQYGKRKSQDEWYLRKPDEDRASYTKRSRM